MTPLSVYLLAAISTSPAAAVSLAPHEAVYDLSLATQSRDLLGVEGRVSIAVSMEECSAYDLAYNFVARFDETDEITLTEQHIDAREDEDGSTYAFAARSVVDGVEQEVVEGSARSEGDETRVAMRQPVERAFSIPRAYFPLAHTRHLIERARAGDRIVESRLYDGDAEGENLLTTTAIIVPDDPGEASSRPAPLAGLAAWRIDESYFNADSDEDGLPVFHTRYTLFENGVTDDLFMDFGQYALEGGISQLTIGERPDACR